MSEDDVLYGYRLRLLALAGEIGVRPACRAMGVHHSTYYRWKRRVERWGLEALKVRERRRPRMPNELGPHLEQRILAFSLAHPGCGPKRIAAELAREKWGRLRISANGIWRVLRRHGLNTRQRRLAFVAGYAARYERRPQEPEPQRHVEASRPGEVVGLDCFYIGRLSGTKGAVWQYTRSTSPPASPGRSCTDRQRTPGRSDEAAITAFDSTGLAIQDLAIALAALARYRSDPSALEGVGTIELG